MMIYIVEDNDSMRIILRHFVRKQFPSVIFKESDTAEKALLEIPLLKPDLVLIDISLPGMNGIDLVRKLRDEQESMSMLVVTGHEVDLYRDKALQAGADDIVAKDDDEGFLERVNNMLKAGMES